MEKKTLPNIADQIKSGNKEALEFLFREYYKGLCRYAFTLIRDKSSAEDIVQDIFFNLWKNRRKLSTDTTWHSYLYSAVHHNAMQQIRHKKIVLKHEKTVVGNMQHTTSSSDPLQTKELQQAITQTIEQLPTATRDIFNLSRFQGLKYVEIAQKLSISVKTVEAHMGKALKIFRHNLRTYITH